jgi:hypothetical protein
MFSGPYPVSERLGGIGLWLWELGQALSAAGVEVSIVVPAASDLSWPGIRLVPFDEDTWAGLVDGADAVLSTDLPNTRILLRAHAAETLVVTENAVPVEHLDYSALRAAADPGGVYDELRARFLLQCWLTDYFLVRSPAERAGVIAVLAAAGRLDAAHHGRSRRLAHLMSLLPVGYTSHAADHAARAEVCAEPVEFTWSGGLWDYFDTGPVLDAVAQLHGAGSGVRVRFLYPAPAGQPLAEAARLEQRRAARGLHDLVELYPAPLAHTARDGVLKASRALLCIGRDGIENYTCHRLRLRDALLYRLPVVIDSFGASGDWVAQTGIGLTVDPYAPGALAGAMQRLTVDQTLYQRCRAAIDAVRPAHRYEHNLTGLLGFLRAAARAPDAGSRRQHEAVTALLAAHPALAQAPAHLI